MNPKQNHSLSQWLRRPPVAYIYWSPFLTRPPDPMARKIEATESTELLINRLFVSHRCMRAPRGAYIPGFHW